MAAHKKKSTAPGRKKEKRRIARREKSKRQMLGEEGKGGGVQMLGERGKKGPLALRKKRHVNVYKKTKFFGEGKFNRGKGGTARGGVIPYVIRGGHSLGPRKKRIGKPSSFAHFSG